jgi:hypothetical protein
MIDGEFRDRVHDPHDISHGLAIIESGETVKVVVVNDGLWVARGRHVCSVQNPAVGSTSYRPIPNTICPDRTA